MFYIIYSNKYCKKNKLKIIYKNKYFETIYKYIRIEKKIQKYISQSKKKKESELIWKEKKFYHWNNILFPSTFALNIFSDVPLSGTYNESMSTINEFTILLFCSLTLGQCRYVLGITQRLWARQ